MSRRVPCCSGCGLKNKDLRPIKAASFRKPRRLVIGYRAGTEDALDGNPMWARDFADRLPPHDWFPLLRCPFGAQGALKLAMRGANQLAKRLVGCHLEGRDWHRFAASGSTFVCLGPAVFKALQAALMGSAPIKFDDTWGTYIELPVPARPGKAKGATVTVYVASDWTMPGLLDKTMLSVDLARLRHRPAPEPETPVYRVGPKDFRAALAACDPNLGPVAADIETSAFEPEHGVVRTLGIAHPNIGAVVLPIHDLDDRPLCSTKAARKAARTLTALSADDSKTGVVWHNSSFDTHWLRVVYGAFSGPHTLDTRTLHRHLHEVAPHSLAVACSMVWYTGGWKEGLNHGLDARSLEDLMRYNGADCVNTWRLYARLVRSYRSTYGAWPYARWAIPAKGARIHGRKPPCRFGSRVPASADEGVSA